MADNKNEIIEEVWETVGSYVTIYHEMVTSVTVESVIPGYDVDFVIKEEKQDDAFEMSGYEDDLEPISPHMEPNDDVDSEADGCVIKEEKQDDAFEMSGYEDDLEPISPHMEPNDYVDSEADGCVIKEEKQDDAFEMSGYEDDLEPISPHMEPNDYVDSEADGCVIKEEKQDDAFEMSGYEDDLEPISPHMEPNDDVDSEADGCVIKEEKQDDAFEMSGYEDDLEPISPHMEPNDDVDSEADGCERYIIRCDVSFVSVVETNDSEQREDNNNNTNDSEQREDINNNTNYSEQREDNSNNTNDADYASCVLDQDFFGLTDASQQSACLSSAGTDAGAVATPPPPSPPPSDEPCNVEARGRCRRRRSANTAEESSPRAIAFRSTTRAERRRIENNLRERMRMHELNQYFMALREVLLPFGERKLTKKETLQSAVSLIKALKNAICVLQTNKVHFKYTPPPPSPPPSDEPCNVEARGRCRRRRSANTAEVSSPRASAFRATTRAERRRIENNLRERMRMHELNQYFNALREVLPFGERKLTKKETLQSAVSFIKALENAICVLQTNIVHFKFTPGDNSNSCNARKLAYEILSSNPNVSEQDRLNNRRALGITSSDSDSD